MSVCGDLLKPCCDDYQTLRGKVVEDPLLSRLVPVALAIILISALSTIATAAINSRQWSSHLVSSVLFSVLEIQQK